MGDARALPARDYFGLKAASRSLVEHNGGPTDAAALTRADQPNISRQIGADLTRYLAVDVVADLEASCGVPLVTRKLAELSDCLLIQLPRGSLADLLSREVGESAEAFGMFIRDFGQGMVNGDLASGDSERVLADALRLATIVAAIIETLNARAAP